VVIKQVRFTPAGISDAAAGLVGFVSFAYGELRLDGVSLRRTAVGRLALAFPERRDREGRRHPLVRPVNAAARAVIEREVLVALGLQEGTP